MLQLRTSRGNSLRDIAGNGFLVVTRKLQVVARHPLAVRQLVQTISENQGLLAQPPVLDLDALPRHLSPRLFIVDVHLLPIELSKLLRLLRMRCRGARFLVLVSEHAYKEAEILRLLYLGVDGILAFSDKLATNLLAAVDVILGDEMWAPPHLVRRYKAQMDSSRRTISKPQNHLTGREQEVFEMLVRRFSNREISEVLGVSERTVKFHVSNILPKLGIRRRSDLIGSLLGSPTRASI